MQPAAQGPRPSSAFTVFLELLLHFLVPLLSSIRNDWILKNTAVELFLALFPPALVSAAHRQPLTAVRRGFQIPGFSLKCFNTSFLWAQPHWRGERNMAEELHEMPILWGGRFLFLLCRKTEPLIEAVEASPSWVSVRTIESRWSQVVAPEAALGHSQGHDQLWASLVGGQRPALTELQPLHHSIRSSGLDTEEMAYHHRGWKLPPGSPEATHKPKPRSPWRAVRLPHDSCTTKDWENYTRHLESSVLPVSVNSFVLTSPRKDTDISDQWFIFMYWFIYFWLHWVFFAPGGLSLVAASRDYSLLPCVGSSSQWHLLLQSAGSVVVGHRHVESSQTRDWTHSPHWHMDF